MTVRIPGRIAATTGAWPASTAEIALDAWNIDLIDISGEGEFFGGRTRSKWKVAHGIPCEWRMANSEWRVAKRCGANTFTYSLLPFAIRPLTLPQQRASWPFSTASSMVPTM